MQPRRRLIPTERAWWKAAHPTGTRALRRGAGRIEGLDRLRALAIAAVLLYHLRPESLPGGYLGEGAAIAVAMIPFLVASTIFSYVALARRKWQQGGSDD